MSDEFLQENATYQGINGGFFEWDAITTYAVGNVVTDRQGIWLATGLSLNSQPISGNTNWSLVGGNPYVDVRIDHTGITTLPFYAATPTPPGVLVLPAPGPNLVVLPTVAVWNIVDSGSPWFDQALAILYWDVPATGVNQPFSPNIYDQLQTDLSSSQSFVWTIGYQGIPPFFSNPPIAINKPVVMQSMNDASGGGALIGTRSITYRVFYRILPSDIE